MTNPVPRDTPVALSFTTFAYTRSPNTANSSHRADSSMSKGTPRTNSVRPSVTSDFRAGGAGFASASVDASAPPSAGREE